ncbi:MAG: hypothetical protein ABI589_03190 [Burkholderiales bacterium]
MSIDLAIETAFHGPIPLNLSILDHELQIQPMVITEQGATTVAEGQLIHGAKTGAVDRVHYRLEVRNHRLTSSKRRLELAGSRAALAGIAPAWTGAVDHLLALFAQHLALDPDFDRIQIAFPLELAEVG